MLDDIACALAILYRADVQLAKNVALRLFGQLKAFLVDKPAVISVPTIFVLIRIWQSP